MFRDESTNEARGSSPKRWVSVCTTTDEGSGVATTATLEVSGLNADGVGRATATCSGATDVAGNQADPISVTYTIAYATEPGFFTGGPVTLDGVNKGKAGRTYPMEWKLRDGDGQLVTDLSAVESITYQTGWCAAMVGATNDITDATAVGGGLRVTADGEFKFNWKTPKSSACYVLFIDLADSTTKTVYFDLRK